MRKALMLITPVVWVVCAGLAHADVGWDAVVLVGAGGAEYKLSVGVRRDARDGIDGRYDVPAFFTEENAVRAYLALGSEELWRDVRESCAQESCIRTWDIVVEAAADGSPVLITWAPDSFAGRSEAFLTDAFTGSRMDMRNLSSYSFKKAGKTMLRMEVRE